MENSLEATIEFLKSIVVNPEGFLTPLIAGITVYIAYQQYRTNKLRVKFEAFDRRFIVYQAVKKFIVRFNGLDDELVVMFHQETFEAQFFYPSEINDYIKEIATHARDFCKYKREYRDYNQVKPEGYDHQNVVSKIQKEREWFAKQIPLINKKFQKYLDLTKP